jgi:hypothetical protein
MVPMVKTVRSASSIDAGITAGRCEQSLTIEAR